MILVVVVVLVVGVISVFTARRSLFCTQVMESQEVIPGAGMSDIETTPAPEEDLLFTPRFSI